ncbi:MAG: hypothetical protein KF768_04220 [Phycisphaeraceae bacterium]|nr:hypothetical protein [Phycisphaeraceae bacterium]
MTTADAPKDNPPPPPDRATDAVAEAVAATSATSAASTTPAHGARARDHRGRWCRLRPRVGPGEQPVHAERGPVDWSFTIPALGCATFALAGLCGVGTLAYFAVSTITKRAPIWIPLSIAAAGTIAYLVWAFVRRRRRQTALLAESHILLWLTKDRCPACGYSLTDLEPSPDDGRTLCPECGAAWKLGGHPVGG